MTVGAGLPHRSVPGPRIGDEVECPDVPILVAYALADELDDVLPAHIAAHVAACSDCAGFVADVAAYPDITPGTTPPSAEEIAIDADALRLKTKADQHVTPRLLAAYCVGDLAPVSDGLVVEHMADCKRCADAMQEHIDKAVPAGWGEDGVDPGDDASASSASKEEGGDDDDDDAFRRLLLQAGAANWRAFLHSEGGEELWSAEGDAEVDADEE